jgi:tRNA pseudouridine13 synthase
VAGDLVLPYDAAQRAAARGRSRKQEPSEAAPAAAVEQDDAVAAEAVDGEEAEVQDLAGEVHVVTAEEAAAGAWRIEDVVLPLPGSEVRYPQHASSDVYRQLAERDGVSLDSSPHGVKDFSITELPGAYRHLLHRPKDLEVRRKEGDPAPTACGVLPDRLHTVHQA